MTGPQVPQEQDSEFSLDGDFDAERAKSLVARLREENRTLKQDRTPQDEKDSKAIAALKRQLAELEPQAKQFQALEEASKTEAQRLSEAAELAKQDAASARAEAVRYKAAATYGISADHFDLLGSGTEEEISARAEKVAGLLAAQAQPTVPPTSTPPTRPVEQLRPGATPSGLVDEDEAVYAALFGAGK
jgi:hypothetical protein